MPSLEQVGQALLSAFMNAPQVDGRNARVPVDLSVQSKSARARVLHEMQDDGVYWATVPQFPVTRSPTLSPK
jgi:hypothetical protein